MLVHLAGLVGCVCNNKYGTLWYFNKMDRIIIVFYAACGAHLGKKSSKMSFKSNSFTMF